MKRVVAVLIALNIAFLGWNLYRRAAPPPAPVAEPDDEGAPRIALLSEAEPTELRERVRAAPDTESVVVAATDASRPGTGAIDGGAAAEPVAAGSAADGVQPDASDRSVPQEPHSADTLSEDGAIVAADGPARPDPAPIEEVLAAVMPAPMAPGLDARQCYSVGPLTTPEEVAAMARWLDVRGARASLREDERRELALYWVFFPPLPGREQAVALVERLRGQGIGDIYTIPRGDMANAISLGVYSRRDSLERRLEQLRSRGHEPSITPRYRTKKAAWYDVAFGPGFVFQTSGFADAFPAVEMSPGPCDVTPGGTENESPAGNGTADGAAAPADVSAETSAAAVVGESAERTAGAAPPTGTGVAGATDPNYDPAKSRRRYQYSGPAPLERPPGSAPAGTPESTR